MATYKGREVRITQDLATPAYTHVDRVQIEFVNEPTIGTMTVSRGELEYTEEEKKAYSDQRNKEVKAEIDGIQIQNTKVKEAKAKEFASKLPTYDKDKLYQTGDLVRASNGKAYKSTQDDNLANVPADNSAYWTKAQA